LCFPSVTCNQRSPPKAFEKVTFSYFEEYQLIEVNNLPESSPIDISSFDIQIRKCYTHQRPVQSPSGFYYELYYFHTNYKPEDFKFEDCIGRYHGTRRSRRAGNLHSVNSFWRTNFDFRQPKGHFKTKVGLKNLKVVEDLPNYLQVIYCQLLRGDIDLTLETDTYITIYTTDIIVSEHPTTEYKKQLFLSFGFIGY
jgi:hypothetical protein